MAIKSLVVAIFLFLLYSYFVSLNSEKYNLGQHQWQDNVIRAQNYLYSDTVPLNVIIGSSMSCRITDSILPSSFYKLTLGGQGIMDGLSVITHHQKPPQTIFVEMNMIERELSNDFRCTLFSIGLLDLRRPLLALQDRYQPCNLLAGYVAPIIGIYLYEPIAANTINRILPKFVIQSSSTEISNVTQKMNNSQEILYSKPLDSVYLNNQMIILKQYVDALSNKGSRFVFFEMPMSSSIEYSVRQLQIRKVFDQYFSPINYRYLKKPDYKEYQTTDGTHLEGVSADNFTRYFLSQVKSPSLY